MNPSLSCDQYRQWRWRWTPFFPTITGLYIVKYPGDLLQMTRPLYQELITLRLQCLIQDWMIATKATQQQTHQQLDQVWQQLEPTQESPPWQEDPQQWQAAWAEHLIAHNSRFWQQLRLRMDRNFPFRMHPPIPSEQEQLRAREQVTTLDRWLIELTDR